MHVHWVLPSQLLGYDGTASWKDMMVLLAARDVMFLSAAGMRRYCQLEGYDGTASCRVCYIPDSCSGEKIMPAGRI